MEVQLNTLIKFSFPGQNLGGVAFTAAAYEQAYRRNRNTILVPRFSSQEQVGPDLVLSGTGADGRQSLTYTLANARLEADRYRFDRLTIRFSEQSDPITAQPYSTTEVLEGNLAFDRRFRTLSGRLSSQLTSSSDAIRSEIFGNFDAGRFFSLTGRRLFRYLTRANDEITGTDTGDRIQSGRGNDLIRAGAGNDLVAAGAGLNQVSLQEGRDTLQLSPVRKARSLRRDGDITTVSDFDPGEDGLKLRAERSRYRWGFVSTEDGSVESWLLYGRRNLVARFLGAPNISDWVGTDPVSVA